MLEIRNRKTLRSRINICKNDVKIGDRADSHDSNYMYYIPQKRYYIVENPYSNVNRINICCNIVSSER